jgi:hypothetical protein
LGGPPLHMRLPEQIHLKGTPPVAMIRRRLSGRVDGKAVVAQPPKDGVGAKVPTRPTERRISIPVLCVPFSTCVEQQLDALLRSEGGCAVQRSLPSRSGIPHERVGLGVRECRSVWVGTLREEHSHHVGVRRAIGLARGRVEGCLTRQGIRESSVSTLLNQKLAQLPVTVKGRVAEAQILAKRLQAGTRCQKEPHGADIAVSSTPLHERDAVRVERIRRVTSAYILEHQVSPTVSDLVKHASAPRPFRPSPTNTGLQLRRGTAEEIAPSSAASPRSAACPNPQGPAAPYLLGGPPSFRLEDG